MTRAISSQAFVSYFHDSNAAYELKVIAHSPLPRIEEVKMPPTVCEGRSPFSFSDSCVLTLWTNLIPAIFIACICLVATFRRVRPPNALRKASLMEVFTPFMTLREAELYEHDQKLSPEEHDVSFWRMCSLSSIGMAEAAVWMGLACYNIATVGDYRNFSNTWGPMITAFCWLYASLRPILRPTATPPYDLFALYTMQLVSALLRLGVIFFNHDVYGEPLPGTATMVAVTADLVAIASLLCITLSMPLGVPGSFIDRTQIVRESCLSWSVPFIDYFFRVSPLARKTTVAYGTGCPFIGFYPWSRK